MEIDDYDVFYAAVLLSFLEHRFRFGRNLYLLFSETNPKTEMKTICVNSPEFDSLNP